MQKLKDRKEFGNVRESFNYIIDFQLGKKRKILDIGCNIGTLINSLYLDGYKNVYGLEVRDEAIKRGREEYKGISKRISYYDGKKIPFPNESFDVVLMFDVIEHIPDIERYLKEEVFRILRKDGIFIFQTPNKYINVPWEMARTKSISAWKSYHPSLQTKSSLKKILMYTGFKEIDIVKRDIFTEYNKSKVRRDLGGMFIPLLYIANLMPSKFSPSLWGSAKKII